MPPSKKQASARPQKISRFLDQHSILEEMFALLEKTSPMRISFEDLSGVVSDVRDLFTERRWRAHSCEFCTFAKSRRSTHRDCLVNKMATNRIAGRRGKSFSGQCHLGVTDIVHPLVYQGHVLGIFYYGSVVVEGTEPLARKRIAKYCARRKVNPAPFLTRLKRLPRISPEALTQAQSRLNLASRICIRILEAYGMPSERYHTDRDTYEAHLRRHHILVQTALRYIHQNYRNTIRLSDVASHVKCHPDHLCRLFKKQVGCGLGEFVERVRINHARKLISTGRFSIGEIAFQVGFNNQSYFNRIFKTRIGCTPGEFAQQGPENARQTEP